jgi:hypothetical protein
MVSISHIDCPECNTRNSPEAAYCGHCGTRLPGSQVKCNNCGTVVAADKKYCTRCGKPLAESAAPMLTGNRWARNAGDFATKVEVGDVKGFFRKGLVVEPGTQAIFFVGGAYTKLLDRGTYDMGGLSFLGSSPTATAVLVDASDVELAFSFENLVTRDPIRLSADCRLVVRMDDPPEFFENMMKGRQNYSLAEMRAFLEGEIRNSLQESIGSRSVQDLSTNLALKQSLERAVAEHLARTFDRKGLAFVQVRIFDFRHPHMNAFTSKLEEYWLHAQDLEARLAREGATAGLERKVMDLETAQALRDVEVFEERARVFERMRKAVASASMDKVTGEKEMEDFLHEIDKDKLLRADELEELKRSLGEKKENHDTARRHLIERLKLDQQAELARAGTLSKISLNRTVTDALRNEEMAQLEHELAAERKRLESRQAAEWAEVEQRRRQAEQEIDLARKKRQADIDMDETRDQADMRTALGALDLLKKQKAIKHDELDREAARQLQIDAQRHQQELARLQVLSTLSTEALITTASPERAALLAELKQTETLKGLSSDEILAMAAGKNAAVAEAFKEKFKNNSSSEIRELYDRMLGMKDQSADKAQEMSREYLKMMQEMFNRGLDTQRDTAMAATRATQPGMTVITPGTVTGGVQTGSARGARQIRCPNCDAQRTEGNRYCDACGHKLPDQS